jgi:hypothetical protein
MKDELEVQSSLNALYVAEYGYDESPTPLSVKELPVERAYQITRIKNNKHTIIPQRVVNESLDRNKHQNLIEFFKRLRQEP